MPTRSLLLVAALAAGDYLLWTWSSDGNSSTVALVSGLALALLLIALLWLVTVGVVRSLLLRALLGRTRSGNRQRSAERDATGSGHRPADDTHRAARRARIPTQTSGGGPRGSTGREQARRPVVPGGEGYEDRATAGSASSTASRPARSDRVAA